MNNPLHIDNPLIVAIIGNRKMSNKRDYILAAIALVLMLFGESIANWLS